MAGGYAERIEDVVDIHYETIRSRLRYGDSHARCRSQKASDCRRCGAGPSVADRLRGSKPAEVTIQQADCVEFVVSLTTARALGLSILRSLLDRANRFVPA